MASAPGNDGVGPQRDDRLRRPTNSWGGHEHSDNVLFRVVMGWIYANGERSLVLAILIHAVDNTCWKLFPNDGSHYNPTAMAAVMVIVTMPIIMFVKARREAG